MSAAPSAATGFVEQIYSTGWETEFQTGWLTWAAAVEADGQRRVDVGQLHQAQAVAMIRRDVADLMHRLLSKLLTQSIK